MDKIHLSKWCSSSKVVDQVRKPHPRLLVRFLDTSFFVAPYLGAVFVSESTRTLWNVYETQYLSNDGN